MGKKTLTIIQFFFGKTTKAAFKRAMILLITCMIGFMLMQNMSFKIKIGSFEFNWNPFADIEIKR